MITRVETSDPSLVQAPRGITKGIIPYLIIGAIAFIVRVPVLFKNYPLGFDDGLYSMSARHVADGAIPFRQVFSSQGAYFLPIISLPSHFTDLYYAPRIIPILAGIVAAILVFQISKNYIPQSWSLFAAIIVATSGSLIRTTGPVTSDGLLICVSLFVVLFAVWVRDRPSVFNIVLLGLSIGVGLGVKNLFMAPALLYTIAMTWRICLKKKIIIASIASLVFIIPIVIYGVSDVYVETILYHLEKNTKRDISGNLDKILHTFRLFDVPLILLMIVSLSIAVYVLSKSIFTQSFSQLTKAALSFINPNSSPVSVFIVYYFVPVWILVCIQSPMFRNHIASLVAPSVIVCCAVIYSWQNKYLHSNYRQVFVSLGLVIMFASSIISLVHLYGDGQFVQSGSEKGIIAVLRRFPAKTQIITNDSGLAYASGLDVPQGIEESSIYRFMSADRRISITPGVLRNMLDEQRICAVVYSPVHQQSIVRIDQVAPDNWNKEYIRGGYVFWTNPNPSCLAENE